MKLTKDQKNSIAFRSVRAVFEQPYEKLKKARSDAFTAWYTHKFKTELEVSSRLLSSWMRKSSVFFIRVKKAGESESSHMKQAAISWPHSNMPYVNCLSVRDVEVERKLTTWWNGGGVPEMEMTEKSDLFKSLESINGQVLLLYKDASSYMSKIESALVAVTTHKQLQEMSEDLYMMLTEDERRKPVKSLVSTDVVEEVSSRLKKAKEKS